MLTGEGRNGKRLNREVASSSRFWKEQPRNASRRGPRHPLAVAALSGVSAESPLPHGALQPGEALFSGSGGGPAGDARPGTFSPGQLIATE